jgi:hypothetical protein
MAELSNGTTNKLNYQAHSEGNLLPQVQKAYVVIFPRGLLTAGFSAHGDLLLAHYTEHKDSLPTWILDFYEHRFIDEKLLQQADRVISVFIATDKYMLVPDDLYDSEEAQNWFRKIYFIEANEMIESYHVREEKCRYLYAYPSSVRNLANRYFAKASLLPLAAYQFFKPFKSDPFLQCCVTKDQVVATAYKNRSLVWHQVFAYSNTEDIAYQLQLVCSQYRINPQQLEVHASVIHQNLNDVVQDLTQYFPNLKYGSSSESMTSSGEWAKAVELLRQLYACAS